MQPAADMYAKSPEPLLVRLAGRGDGRAFEELVRRRQSWIRNLLRRLSRDATLADDLAQQVFLQTWRTIAQLRQPAGFPGWLKRTAVNTWLQHVRRNDPLRAADAIGENDDSASSASEAASVAIDLDDALAKLPDAVRVCIVLSYYEHMSHAEIAKAADLPLGTVKSHIRRGTEQLRSLLADYAETATTEAIS